MNRELVIVLAFLAVVVLAGVLMLRSVANVVVTGSASYSAATNVDSKKGEVMKRLKTILTTRKQKVLIHDPIAALIARMCDPADPIYDENVAKTQLEKNEDTEQR